MIEDTVVSRNTPKGVDTNSAVIPSAYVVDSLEIRNQYGQVKDMTTLVTSFTITEELFSPVIVLNAAIRDTINFFEDFSLNGQETLRVKLTKTDTANVDARSRKIDMVFTVKEYPNYEKSVSSLGSQEYNLIAVSDYAYLSMLQRISRSVKGNPIDNIQNIFSKDLNVKRFNVPKLNPCITTFDGVITIQSPLKAIEWLRTKAYDAKGSPFFVYNNILDNKIICRSWFDMISARLYPSDDLPYKYSQYLLTQPGTAASYSENISRILNMKSNIKLDKLSQATSGGFANKIEVTDYSKKTFIQKLFNIDTDSRIEKDRLKRQRDIRDTTVYGSAMKFLTKGGAIKNLTSMNDASISKLSTNTNSNSSGAPNVSGVYEQQLGAAKSYLANMESMSHEVVVYGDFKLNPGSKIRIEVPRSDTHNNDQSSIELDESLSGEYIVAVAVHNFSEGIYTTRIKIIRDNA